MFRRNLFESISIAIAKSGFRQTPFESERQALLHLEELQDLVQVEVWDGHKFFTAMMYNGPLREALRIIRRQYDRAEKFRVSTRTEPLGTEYNNLEALLLSLKMGDRVTVELDSPHDGSLVVETHIVLNQETDGARFTHSEALGCTFGIAVYHLRRGTTYNLRVVDWAGL